MSRMHAISAFIICKNEADRIKPCLESIAGWVDQLIIMDSGSDDNTVSIAKKYTNEVYVTDWPGYGKQRNRALAKCKHKWVLTIDADERLSKQAKQEIDDLFSVEHIDFNMVKFPWKTYFLDQALHYGRFATPQGKLFNQQQAKFNDGSVHEQILMQEKKCCTVSGVLEHYSWRDYQHLQEKHLEYANLQALERYQAGKRSSITQALLSFAYSFFWQYIIRLGFINGTRGFMIAMTLAHYELNRYLNMVSQELSTQAASK